MCQGYTLTFVVRQMHMVLFVLLDLLDVLQKRLHPGPPTSDAVQGGTPLDRCGGVTHGQASRSGDEQARLLVLGPFSLALRQPLSCKAQIMVGLTAYMILVSQILPDHFSICSGNVLQNFKQRCVLMKTLDEDL